MTGVDCERCGPHTRDGEKAPYDRLVLATGSTTNFFGTEGIEGAAMGLTDLPEAMELRNHVRSFIERAARAWEHVRCDRPARLTARARVGR